MNALVSTAINRARMVMAFVVLSLVAGWIAYTSLPKEGDPNIDIPVIYVSVSYPGVSALDAERLLVKPLEQQLRTLEGLKTMTGIATEGHASVSLEFEFGFDKDAILAEVRAEVDKAQSEFPADANEPSISEVNTSLFPILNITVSGGAPDRTRIRVAERLQDVVEGIPQVLEANISGNRAELLEVVVDPGRLEAYGVTAGQLLQVVANNNQIVPAGQVRTETGAFSVKLPGSVETLDDIYNLPIKVDGAQVVTLRDLAEVRRTFEDRETIARFNGEPTVALSVVKRTGENIIQTVDAVKAAVEADMATWPEPLKQAVDVDFSLDQAKNVRDMVGQLESSVITAVSLVMIVVVATLGLRSAALVAFAIPTSFLLAFALLQVLGMTINNMVMFGLILAVGMLVDGAIVVTEYADKRRADGASPAEAYGEAAGRMFWPIVASTATTLCAFLPMLFWPGMPGEFMRYLPITLIFVLSASLLVALIYLPVTGMLLARLLNAVSASVKGLRFALGWGGAMALGAAGLFGAIFAIEQAQSLALAEAIAAAEAPEGAVAVLAEQPATAPPAMLFFGLAAIGALAALYGFAAAFRREERKVEPYQPPRRRYGPYGMLLRMMTNNPVAPLAVIGAVGALMVGIFTAYGERGLGVEFFVETEPEIANFYVSARGNHSLQEKDAMMRAVEARITQIPDVDSILTVVGSSGNGSNGGVGGDGAPKDSIGYFQFEFENWRTRGIDGKDLLVMIREKTADMPGIRLDLREQADGPQQGKPIQLEVSGVDFENLKAATRAVQDHFQTVDGLRDVDTTLPLPGIEWELRIDRTEAGKFGADVATLGAYVQMVTRGVYLDDWTPDDSDDPIDIRARFDQQYRTIDMLDRLRVETNRGLIPIGNFVEREPVPQLSEITRVDGKRVFTVRADVDPGVNANAKIAEIGEWLEKQAGAFGPQVSAEFKGDFEEQQKSQQFLMTAFAGALGLMFIILLAQFDSLYNSVLVLIAVVLSVGGVLVGMMVMGQPFSIIMTGIGIVALAGIVVNNNIVLIDTFQDLRKTMPDQDAIVETGRQRLRPVLLTTITTMAGLLPMMFAVSIDLVGREISVGAPTALWWTQLATAIVFGLGFATVLTLFVTPSLLALRVWWFSKLPQVGWRGIKALVLTYTVGRRARFLRDRETARRTRKFDGQVIWTEMDGFYSQPVRRPVPIAPLVEIVPSLVSPDEVPPSEAPPYTQAAE